VQNLVFSTFLFKNTKIKVHRTLILPFVLYGYEIWSFTLRAVGGHRLRVPESRMLRKIFGPKKDKVTAAVEVRMMR
jgi:hypothetical protein